MLWCFMISCVIDEYLIDMLIVVGICYYGMFDIGWIVLFVLWLLLFMLFVFVWNMMLCKCGGL